MLMLNYKYKLWKFIMSKLLACEFNIDTACAGMRNARTSGFLSHTYINLIINHRT